jgi:hypothetical protein
MILRSFGSIRRWLIDDHFGGSEELLTATVAALKNFKDGVVGISRIMALGNRFMQVRIERLTGAFLGFDAVLAEQLPQLLHRQLHALKELPRIVGLAAGQGPFEVVEGGEQFMDE